MEQVEIDRQVEEMLERWRDPPPMTEEEKKRARAMEALAEELDEDDD